MAYPYGMAARIYLAAGFRPLPAKGKDLIVKDVSGGYREATTEEIERWRVDHAQMNVVLRLPENVIALDVDNYKGDVVRLRMLEESIGEELPVTWNSDARGGDGGKLLYRVTHTDIKWPQAVADITIAQHTHRYVIAPPSVNPITKTPYRWYQGLGGPVIDDQVPTVAELPLLGPLWQSYLFMKSESRGPVRRPSEESPGLDSFNDGDPCQHFSSLEEEAADALHNAVKGNGGLHDTMLHYLGKLAQHATYGHSGFAKVLDTLEPIVTKSNRERDMVTEWNNAVSYVLAQQATAKIERHDPCKIQIIYTPKSQAKDQTNDAQDKLSRLRSRGLSYGEAQRLLRRLAR